MNPETNEEVLAVEIPLEETETVEEVVEEQSPALGDESLPGGVPHA